MHYIFLTDFALMLAEGILFVKMVVFIFNKRSIVNQLILPCWSRYNSTFTTQFQNDNSKLLIIQSSLLDKDVIKRKIIRMTHMRSCS